MKSRLLQEGMVHSEDDDPDISISVAWNALSGLGYPARYAGKAQDGSTEYAIINPLTGEFLTIGKGKTLEQSICDAALKANTILDTS